MHYLNEDETPTQIFIFLLFLIICTKLYSAMLHLHVGGTPKVYNYTLTMTNKYYVVQ